MTPLILMIPFLINELVAIHMPQLVFTMHALSSMLGSIVARSRSSYKAIA
jgi:hypothetical protein